MFNVYIDTRDNILNEARQRVGTFSVFFSLGNHIFHLHFIRKTIANQETTAKHISIYLVWAKGTES